MPPAKKNKSTKKGSTKRNAAAASSSKSSTTTNVPRSNDEIIGNTWRTRVIKKQIQRELNEALVYEATSDKRKEIVDKINSLDGVSVRGDGCTDASLMPATYESEPMINYAPPRRFMLTVGKTAPFYIEKKFHGRPVNMLAGADYPEDILEGAKIWTGKEPTLHVLLPNLSMGNQCTIYLGECYLDKEDPLLFAHTFAKGVSNFDWPDSFAVHQCPFCCKMAQPWSQEEENIEEASYIMIIQNIMQHVYSKGKNNLTKIHRGFPRLCCKGCFGKNLVPQPEEGEEHTYPGILKHGIFFHAAKNLFSNKMGKIIENSYSTRPSAYSLYHVYKKCGMIAAVDEVIYINQKAELDLLGMMGLSVGTSETIQNAMAEKKREK